MYFSSGQCKVIFLYMYHGVCGLRHMLTYSDLILCVHVTHASCIIGHAGLRYVPTYSILTKYVGTQVISYVWWSKQNSGISQYILTWARAYVLMCNCACRTPKCFRRSVEWRCGASGTCLTSRQVCVCVRVCVCVCANGMCFTSSQVCVWLCSVCVYVCNVMYLIFIKACSNACMYVLELLHTYMHRHRHTFLLMLCIHVCIGTGTHLYSCSAYMYA